MKTENKPYLKTTAILGGIVLLYLFMVASQPPAQKSEMETCGTCHQELVNTFKLQPHSSNLPNTCTSCHGSAETHLEEAAKSTIFAFKNSDGPVKKSKKCLNCHSQNHPRFPSSPHGKSSMDCTSCHVIHSPKIKPFLLTSSPSETCFKCHKNVFAQFELNEKHRLKEEILSCTSCHDPHQPALRERLAGFKQQKCIKCHTDKGGPFLYEHQASRVEGCTVCHQPHGSPNRHLLTHQSIADLCFSCHTAAPSWHSGFDSYSTNCTTCHSTIHGSNFSKLFLK